MRLAGRDPRDCMGSTTVPKDEKPSWPASSVLQKGNHCWLSGTTLSAKPADWWAPWLLEVAHIASGQGRARRVDDRRAVVVLCSLAHRLHVSDADRLPTAVINGTEYPTIDERHTLYIKKCFDREFFDRSFLQGVWIGRVPEPKRPPDFWCEQMYNNQGIMY